MVDARATFVLSRIDGRSTIRELCQSTGLGESDTLAALLDLKRGGLLELQEAPVERHIIPNALITGEESSEAEGEELNPETERSPQVYPPFFGVDPEDVAFLRGRKFGLIAGTPYRRPGEGRFGRFTFKRKALLQRCDLSIQLRREIIFLDETEGKLDHFEFFDIPPTTERKRLKHAYFSFSKRFHPDSYYGKDFGPFLEPMKKVFKYGGEIYSLFSNDELFLQVYMRAIIARNQSYRRVLEVEREKQQMRAKQLRMKAAAQRKERIKGRLEKNTHTRRRRTGNPITARLERAHRYYEAGMKQYESGSFIQAATSLQMAMSSDPNNQAYRRSFERVKIKANQINSDQLWKRGVMDESVGRMKEAVYHYLMAVEAHPRADYCSHLAGILLRSNSELHRAAELARLAVDADPQNVDYLVLLGQIYSKVELYKKAITVFERALKLEPDDEEIKKALKALRKK